MAKSKIGGARKGSGRKPVADKRIAVTLYIQESIVKSYGGIDGIREYLYKTFSKINKDI